MCYKIMQIAQLLPGTMIYTVQVVLKGLDRHTSGDRSTAPDVWRVDGWWNPP